jgi:hypothetical protein
VLLHFCALAIWSMPGAPPKQAIRARTAHLLACTSSGIMCILSHPQLRVLMRCMIGLTLSTRACACMVCMFAIGAALVTSCSLQVRAALNSGPTRPQISVTLLHVVRPSSHRRCVCTAGLRVQFIHGFDSPPNLRSGDAPSTRKNSRHGCSTHNRCI